nr:MAG TPA: Major capsid protein [Microviridae sp.]
MKKTLGGERLGAGKKMAVELENFGRSSNNLSKIVRTDQSFATIVPYYCEIGLTGDTFYINEIESIIRTLPTNGPIFGSAKFQVDVFCVPIRLYMSALHNNALGVGLKMANIKLPKLWEPVTRDNNVGNEKIDEYLIKNANNYNPSSLPAYLGKRGLPVNTTNTELHIKRQALFELAYWDIYKNYYANKQEEIGFVIGPSPKLSNGVIIYNASAQSPISNSGMVLNVTEKIPITSTNLSVQVQFSAAADAEKIGKNVYLKLPAINNSATPLSRKLSEANEISQINRKTVRFTFSIPANQYAIPSTSDKNPIIIDENKEIDKITGFNTKNDIRLQKFDLNTIDNLKEEILATPSQEEFILPTSTSSATKYPFLAPLYDTLKTRSGVQVYGRTTSQCGLGIRTYLSDRFNNWLNTEWIDGTNGINEITSVDVKSGLLTMDALILQKKVYDMLNRIAVSGGSYRDWQEAVFGVRVSRAAESPIYIGGYASEIVFDEVVSTAAFESGETGQEPLGSLAGRGRETSKRGGKNIKIRCEEPSLIMILGSIVPRVDYSQGNKWWTRINTMNDFHKPNLDQIGFQELLSQEMNGRAWKISGNYKTTDFSVGKQPAWTEYTTTVNETYGDFAAGEPLEYMAFNRVYEVINDPKLKDATTYIDPQIFNKAFANSNLDAKNFWVQIGFDVIGRRVKSAREIPNL